MRYRGFHYILLYHAQYKLASILYYVVMTRSLCMLNQNFMEEGSEIPHTESSTASACRSITTV